jgi:hypothetical protein
MKYRTSFAEFTVHADNILEMVINEGVVVSLEMIEEIDHFIAQYFTEDFILLINGINNYTYSYEAQLCIASNEYLKGIAFLYYSNKTLEVIEQLKAHRKMDNWNSKTFSGLELGRQQAYTWSKNELSSLSLKVN